MIENVQEEKSIKNAIEPVSLTRSKKIIEQMEKCVCKIYVKGSTGTGFFSKIPYQNKELKVLITNNHVLDEYEIKYNKIIVYSLNDNENNKKFIEINNNRKIYINEILDVTIIEINENQDDIHDYIELDDEIDIKQSMNLNKETIIKLYKNIYSGKSIYILNYLNGKNIVVSYGLLFKINEENGIIHKCNTDLGSSGSPILSLKNNKLIGVHYGCSKNKNIEHNYGTLIIYPIIEFQNISNNLLIIRKIHKIQYKIPERSHRISLFGEFFVKKNKNNCKIIIDNKEQDLTSNLFLDECNESIRGKKTLEIKLKEIERIIDMSEMFQYCSELSLTSDISKLVTKHVKAISGIFSHCECNSLPDISTWDVSNVTDMSSIFSFSSNLSSLPDISQWDVSNVTDMRYMFWDCSNLSSLPDISKWNTKNVTNMSYMFSNCENLSSLPDISQWDVSNVTNMSFMFNNCKNLSSLPDISQWDVSNVTDMSYMFNFCSNLSSLPDISQWDIKNVTNMGLMFNYCSKLSSLPDIDNWNIEKICIEGMFNSCSALSILPSNYNNKNRQLKIIIIFEKRFTQIRLTFNIGTPINLALKKYLETSAQYKLEEKVSFYYNFSEISLCDNTPIEIFFFEGGFYTFARIQVSDL